LGIYIYIHTEELC